MANLELYKLERKNLIEDWARYTAERLQKSLDKKKVGRSGSLKYSLMYELMSGNDGDISSIKHMFNYYGRFVDMGVGKGKKIGDVKGDADLVRMMGGRKPKKWYSKSYYAETITLSDLLMKKYTEQTSAVIVENFKGI